MTTELAIRPDQTGFDDKQMAALRALGVQNASSADVAIFFHQAARTGLDPFARQIYLINRGGKQTIQTGIDGFRLIRDRAGTYRGHTEEWCGPDGRWRDVWLEQEPPAAARVQLYVEGYQQPVTGIALWTEYAQLGRDGKPQALWNPRGGKPALMLAKCAEALALRKAYPQDLSGLYTTDEIPEAEQTADGVHTITQVQPARFDPAPWEDRIAYAETTDDLHKVWLQAGDNLDQALSDGQTMRATILAKKARLEQNDAAEAAATSLVEPDYDDEAPF